MAGERTTEPTFGLPALWIEEALRDEALARGCTVVDAAGVLATHLTETVREHMPELLSFAETQKLLDELPREHQKLVADVVPAQMGVGTLQRVLQSLLARNISMNRMKAIGYGLTYPKYSNDTENGRAGNRRVEFQIFANEQMKQDAAREAGR